MFILKGYLPVAESFGFNEDLRRHTDGQASSQSVFNHWEQMDGDPLEKGSTMEDLVKRIRKLKGFNVRLDGFCLTLTQHADPTPAARNSSP